MRKVTTAWWATAIFFAMTTVAEASTGIPVPKGIGWKILYLVGLSIFGRMMKLAVELMPKSGMIKIGIDILVSVGSLIIVSEEIQKLWGILDKLFKLQ